MARERLTAEFGMGSGLIAPQKPPGRRNTRKEANWVFKIGIVSTHHLVRSFETALRASSGCGLWMMPCSSHHLVRKVPDFSGRCFGWALINESVQAERAISTGKLHALLRFHTRPIDVVVFHGSSGRTRFEAGFPLRCLQRLSVPYIATLHCGWRHNRSTRGTFTPVLSY